MAPTPRLNTDSRIPELQNHADATAIMRAAATNIEKANVTDFTLYANPTVSLVCLPAGASVFFPLDLAARLTGVHPEMLRYYHRAGLIEALPAERESELLFDEDTLQNIRQIEHFRRHLGVGRRALPLLCELQREGNRLDIELRFLDCS